MPTAFAAPVIEPVSRIAAGTAIATLRRGFVHRLETYRTAEFERSMMEAAALRSAVLGIRPAGARALRSTALGLSAWRACWKSPGRAFHL